MGMRSVERAPRQRQRRFHSAATCQAGAKAAAAEMPREQAREIRKVPCAQKCSGVVTCAAPRYWGALGAKPTAVGASTSRVKPTVKSGLVGDITFPPTIRMKG